MMKVEHYLMRLLDLKNYKEEVNKMDILKVDGGGFTYELDGPLLGKYFLGLDILYIDIQYFK